MQKGYRFQAPEVCILGSMRNLGDEYKLSFRSIPEVYEAFGTLVSRAATNPKIRMANQKEKGKKPHKASVLNAILLWFVSQPATRQMEILSEGMDKLNAILSGGAPEGKSAMTANGNGAPDVLPPLQIAAPQTSTPPKKTPKTGSR